jgi:preprotein translocase subunit SecG
MTFPPVLAIGVLINIVAVLFVLVSIILILVVLVQKGRGGGLSGAFGGGMASGLLGSKTGDFLTWVTIVLVGVFLVFAVVLAKYYRPRVGEFGGTAPATTQQPATPAEQPTAPAPPPGAPTAQPAAPTEQAPALPPAEQPGATVPAPPPVEPSGATAPAAAPSAGADANGSGK